MQKRRFTCSLMFSCGNNNKFSSNSKIIAYWMHTKREASFFSVIWLGLAQVQPS